MFWDFVLMQSSPFVQFRQKYKTSKQHSLAAKDRNLHPVAILNSTARTTRWTGTASEKNAQFLRAKFEK